MRPFLGGQVAPQKRPEIPYPPSQATHRYACLAPYDRASVVGATTEDAPLIVTSASACLALSCAPAADFRRSCGPTHRPG